MGAKPSLWPDQYRKRLLRVVEILAKERVTRAASAMAFDLFLALIPLLAFVGWLTATVVHDHHAALQTLSALLDVTPQETSGVLSLQFESLSVGAVAPLSAIGALWMASSAFDTPLRVLDEEVGSRARVWWQTRLIALGCVLAAVAALSLSGFLTLLVLGGPSELMELFVTRVTGREVSLAYLISLIAALGTVTGLLAAFYSIAPRRPRFQRRVWPGTMVAVAMGVLASVAFGYYATHLAQFRLFYGSLAAVAITLGWLWLISIALLFGAEFNLLLERKSGAYKKVPPRQHETPSI